MRFALWLAAMAASATLCAEPGLVARYADERGSLAEVVAVPHLRLAADQAPHPALSARFQAEFRGSLRVLRAGRYRFFHAGAELRLDGAPVAGEVELAAGEYAVELRAGRRASGPFALVWEWQGPDFGREPVPASLLSHAPGEGPSESDREVERGRQLAEEFGCANCHPAAATLARRPAPPLDGVGARTRPAWLSHWLAEPALFPAQRAMPATLDAAAAADAAAYLATLRADSPEAVRARRQDGEAGFTKFQSIGCIACHGEGGVSLAGLGSKTGVEHLRRYLLDPARWEPSGRMPSLGLSEAEALELATYLAESRKPEWEAPALPGDAARGRAAVERGGCAACHSLAGATAPPSAKDLSALDPTRGCLADAPAAPAPRYALDAGERDDLRAFVAFYRARPDRSPAPVHRARARLKQLRCAACHSIDGQPAAAALAERAPALDATGEKLRQEWIVRAVSEPHRAWDWIELRMPSYRLEDARVLAQGFARTATAPRSAAPAGDTARGHGMLGALPASGGMGCIGCHGWGEHASLGEHGPNLKQAAERLRADWFERWMRDPARILSGTSMPNYFAGQTAAQAGPTIGLLWAGLAAPETLGPPPGFVQATAERGSEALPHPETRAIVVRWDMPEATPAAIAVGLPGGLSYCFDAGASRLLYAWSGGFVDLGPTLYQKTNKATGLTEVAHLVGEVFYRESEFPFRVDAEGRVPARRFRGYRMTGGAPEFRYTLDGLDVYERIAAEGGALVRQFRLPLADRPLRFAAGEGAVTTLGPDGRIPLGEDVRFEVRIAPPR